MDILDTISLSDCPVCGGHGSLEVEAGWCVYAVCADCGSHTAEIEFKNEDERVRAANISADLWNMGKVVNTAPGE